MSNTPLDKKIKRISNILKENAEYQARQRVKQAMRDPRAVELPERKSLEDEMTQQAPAEKHGHKVNGAGFQEFTELVVDTPARLVGRSHSVTNMGYRTESFSQREKEFIATATGGLKRSMNNGGVPRQVVFERFVAMNAETPAHLVEAVGHHFGISPSVMEALGVISEGNYGYAEGGYVEVMPDSGKTTKAVDPKIRSAFAADEQRRKDNAVTRNAVEGDKELPKAQRPADDFEGIGSIKTDAQLRREKESIDQYEELLSIKEMKARYEKLIAEEPEGGMSAVYRDKLAGLHNRVKTLKAASDKRKDDEEKEKEEAESLEKIKKVAESMTFGASGQFAVSESHRLQEKQRLQENQARHMSLLESAKSVLDSNFSDSGWC